MRMNDPGDERGATEDTSASTDDAATATAEETSVLIVDDEKPLTDVFAMWLGDDYDVEVANDAATAMAALDERFDVALLDRRLPDGSGEDVLAEIRDREMDCRVAFLSAVTPGLDLVDFDYDLYVEKPVSNPATLTTTVEDLVRRGSYDPLLREFVALRTKRDALDARLDRSLLFDDDRYVQLVSRLDELRDQLPADDLAASEGADSAQVDSTAIDADHESR